MPVQARASDKLSAKWFAAAIAAAAVSIAVPDFAATATEVSVVRESGSSPGWGACSALLRPYLVCCKLGLPVQAQCDFLSRTGQCAGCKGTGKPDRRVQELSLNFVSTPYGRAACKVERIPGRVIAICVLPLSGKLVRPLRPLGALEY